MGQDRNTAFRERRVSKQELLHCVGDNYKFNGFAGYASDRFDHAATMAISGSGIDHDNASRADNEPAVGHETAIKCGYLARFSDEGVDPVSDLLRLEHLLSRQRKRQHRKSRGGRDLQPPPQQGLYRLVSLQAMMGADLYKHVGPMISAITRGAVVAILLAMGKFALGGEIPGADKQSLENFAVTQVAPGNYVHFGGFDERSADNLGDNANIGFVVGEKCVLAIDAGGSLAVGRALRRAIARVTPLPVCYVVLTHVHPDHFFGAAAFLEDQAQLIAHRNYPAQLAARSRSYAQSLQRDLGPLAAGSIIVQPTILVEDILEIDLGGRSVQVQAWPPAHTDNDLTVFDTQTRTFWLSDLLFVDHTPVIDGTITGFLAVMKKLRGIHAAHYVSGHGNSQLAWPEPLDAQERYLTTILHGTRAALRARKTIQQATDEVGWSEAGNWQAFELFHRRNVTAAYTELEWE